MNDIDIRDTRSAAESSASVATRVWTLGSGSGGNAVLVGHGESYLLLDAGFELPELVARIRTVGVAPAQIDDVVLSHGHRDHVIGAAAGSRVYGWRLWATLGTLWHWRALRHVPVQGFEPGDTLALSPFRIETAPTPHDIGESAALVVEVLGSGVRIGYCTDLGHVSPALEALLANLDVLIIEANYDDEMLARGPYGPELQARVSGAAGHLGNAQTAALMRAVASERLRHVVLAHISRHNNTPDVALRAVGEALAAAGFRGALAAAPQDRPMGPMIVGARTGVHAPYSRRATDATFCG